MRENLGSIEEERKVRRFFCRNKKIHMHSPRSCLGDSRSNLYSKRLCRFAVKSSSKGQGSCAFVFHPLQFFSSIVYFQSICIYIVVYFSIKCTLRLKCPRTVLYGKSQTLCSSIIVVNASLSFEF